MNSWYVVDDFTAVVKAEISPLSRFREEYGFDYTLCICKGYKGGLQPGTLADGCW